MNGIALHADTSDLLNPLDAFRENGEHGPLALVDEPGPRVGAVDTEDRDLGGCHQVAVTEIQT
ncbi:hypothetical protein Adi01nite_73940 [Amorphoplanes digitatis]|nr:hypothetical protein GCM10020092_085030 [Actinoplanes digitatis]GID97982.1 hypothetical protein Adi01nite_73940 [Actinoplanes digitatis]